MSHSAKLQKLKITAFSDPDGQSGKQKTFTALINPSSYKRSLEIHYNDPQGPGSPGGSPVFDRIPAETVSFELVFDGTGVVPGSSTASDGIKSDIQDFLDTVGKYNGDIHSPNYLVLSWGSLNMECRLSSLELTYTLFKPDGTPLRARAQVSFLGYRDEKLLQAMARTSSPDLTHVVTVMAGEDLPLLCHRIYGDASLYPRVARYNGLAGFRALAPGSRLSFPPLPGAA